jgi:tRNA pseudouridine38-40 synthase
MTSQKKFLLKISYDGTSFAGWQTQNNSLAIQAIIEEHLSMLLRATIKIEGSGRTDAGVHALEQTAHFVNEYDIDTSNLVYRLNCVLPKSVRILSLEEVPLDFHARYSTVKKTYLYKIYNSPIMDPFLLKKVWHISYPLDLEIMKKAMKKLEGTHDFKAFAAKNNQGVASVDSVRTLDSFSVNANDSLLEFELTSKGFMYKMVRNLVGCIVEIGSHKLELDAIDEAFQSGYRYLIGQTAPACGLYLKKVYYHDASF